MLLIIAIGLILMRLFGVINTSWTLIVIAELLLVIMSIIELKFYYKFINKRFK